MSESDTINISDINPAVSAVTVPAVTVTVPVSIDNSTNNKLEQESKICIEIETQQGLTYCEIYGQQNLTDELLSISNIILIVHGLGGTVQSWESSDIAPYLALQNKVVVCFDWYSHGKSAILDATHVTHDVELFINQLHEVINSKDLPIKGRNFCLHGFSMGCYLVANYLTEYRDNHVDKLVLQSPWNGEIPGMLRFFIRIPFFVRLFRPKFLNGIKSTTTLKQILLELGTHRPWTDILHELSQYEHPATILLIASENDPKLIKQAAKEFQNHMGKKRSALTTTPTAGHHSFVHRDTISSHLKKELVEFYSLIGLPGEGRISVVLSAADLKLELEAEAELQLNGEGDINNINNTNNTNKVNIQDNSNGDISASQSQSQSQSQSPPKSRTVSQADRIIQSESDGSFYVNNKKYGYVSTFRSDEC